MKKTALLLTLFLISTGLLGIIPADGQEPPLQTSVEGTVTDAFSGEPLEYAYIEIWGPGWGMGMTTDTEGYYKTTIDIRVKEDIDIFCSKGGYYEEYTSLEITRGDNAVVDFALEPMNSTVKGYVKDSVTMEPLEYVYVSLYSTEPEGEDVWVQTDESGYFEMSADPGYYKLIAGAQDYERYMSEEFLLEDGETKEVEILLVEIKTGIYGVVSNDEGETLENSVIYLYTEDSSYWNYAHTEDDGSFEIRAPAGEYQISVYCEDHFQYQDSVTVEEDGMTEYNVEMTKISLSSTLEYILNLIKDIIGLAEA